MLLLALLLPLAHAAEPVADPAPAVQASGSPDAAAFLDLYNSIYTSLYAVDAQSSWAASTDVSPQHEGLRTGASQAWNAFVGSPAVVAQAKAFLAQPEDLSPLQRRQLEAVVLHAGASPGDQPELVNARVAAESRAASVQDGFVYCIEPRDPQGDCPEPLVAGDIDEILLESRDLPERRAAWLASKEIGVPLKPELVQLQRLRNEVARAMGYSSFFGLQTAAYDMSADELMALLDELTSGMAPLYGELRTWAARALAAQYGQPVPQGAVPADWVPNRWAQEWPGLVPAVDLDPYFVDRTPESIVRDAEEFYVSIGFSPLPQAFWDHSDLYPVPEGEPRLKNSHASAWDMDLNGDVRSLMSVEPSAEWYFTSHHELGHIYYDLAYDRPEVPPVLREGANRAFHEAIGELAAMASRQVPYLRSRGVLPRKVRLDDRQVLLDEALVQTVVFLPFATGVMSRFEYELYEKDLPPDQWQSRWWDLVQQAQGVAPPDAARVSDPDLCDACTKTHIIDDPGGYYDYAIATVLKFQLHEHICEEILRQDVHQCDYAGHTEVGDWLRTILEKGATEDWRQVVRDATGEDLSARAMVAYYAPLQRWLEKENARAAKGR